MQHASVDDIHILLTLPMTKMLESLVAKLLPVLSFTCTTSKEPGCLSRLVMTPIRPKLAPPVTMHMLPTHKGKKRTGDTLFMWIITAVENLLNDHTK